MPSTPRKLILASGSAYRKSLLARIYADFTCTPPDIDESGQPGESSVDLAKRLANEKAAAVADSEPPGAIVIGSDQVADLNGRQLGKPGNHATAVEQLSACSGQKVLFYTAVCIYCAESGFRDIHVDETAVCFKNLLPTEIDAYLKREQPWDCAGSFKSEGLGPVLLESIKTQDPTAIIGLPLIWLAGSLQRAGLQLL